MQTIHLTVATVAAMFDSIVERFGADHRPASDTGSACIYFQKDGHRLVPVCLIGQVVADLGALRALAIEDYENMDWDAKNNANSSSGGQWGSCGLSNDYLWSSLEEFGITADEDAKVFMFHAQTSQDGGMEWGDAVAAAKDSTRARLQANIEQAVRLARLNLEDAQSENFAALEKVEPLADWERDLLNGQSDFTISEPEEDPFA